MNSLQKTKPIISVIVPVYNVEQYLPMCLESLLAQTYKNLEIICINDGGFDNSLQIMQKYADQDSRIKIILKYSDKLYFFFFNIF